MNVLADHSRRGASSGTGDPFRVVVVDDIEWVRSMLTELLDAVDGVEVCGTSGRRRRGG